jgi:hypothetical protein
MDLKLGDLIKICPAPLRFTWNKFISFILKQFKEHANGYSIC